MMVQKDLSDEPENDAIIVIISLFIHLFFCVYLIDDSMVCNNNCTHPFILLFFTMH